ncbi:hypothetical protein Q9L58_003524 [Maublancomyces gigas]|uniref:Gluconokinase n=1 Tax=Discina gigas TaxID=1032678 RepID=A0ABR3GNJ8_9PEZI
MDMLTYSERPTASVATKPSAIHLMGKVHSVPQERQLRHIWIITGPAGCGKSTVAQFLAKSLNLLYIEGDDFHPQTNVDKMASGIPLTDDDRWDWLETLRNKAVEELEGGADGCIVTCSCLKRRYRDVIRIAGREADGVAVRFVYLAASEELLLRRVRARKDHYMKDDMVHSQFSALEEPDESEDDVVHVDVSGTAVQVQNLTLEKVRHCMDSE